MSTPSWRRVGALSILMFGLAACATKDVSVQVDRDIVSRTEVTGTVNGGVVAGRVSASFNTARGGRSSCDYQKLPVGFTPGTIGTHG